ncbi:PASTA domain-containing protein [Nonomuraea sp. NPDC059194]|uniref:protein kinase domain-containing protein n=1 Tax=Nonomuraea sp. NPDC059194 TaxID=3346764 RepID=UPI00368B251D
MPKPLRTGDPQRLGDYELSGRLGEGGQGIVYLGTLGEESYAIKLLHGPVGDEPAAFMREVELAKHVARFCTAQVVDAGFDDGRPYIVSEYVEGPSLARGVALEGPREGGALERLAVGTATALAAIHRAGIIHRDFKPQNVLLGSDGPRVIDFGLAKALDAAATVSGRGVGTPAYMAPEQITASAITGAVDVFSWGATMCFAANASAPFGQDSVAPVLHRILTAPPALGRLDGQLRSLVAHCLDKDPRNRPTSRELLLALLGAGEGVPAEVLRSPPPHILRVAPHPLAEPEATGAAEGYLLPEIPAQRGAESVAGGRLRSPARRPGSGTAKAGHPVVPRPEEHPAKGWDEERPGWGEGHPGSGEGHPGSGEGHPGSGEAHPAKGWGEGHPSWPGPGGWTPEETHPGRWAGPAANRVSLAVSCALLISAAVLVAVLVPALQSVRTPAAAASKPVAAASTPAAPSGKQSAGKVKDTPATIKRPPPATAPAQPILYSVPGVVGMDRSAATAAIEGAGLVVGSVTEVGSSRPAGEVLGTAPQQGSRVARGTRIDLRVSAGGVEVPALAGLSREDATSALTAAGLKAGKISTSCSGLPEGQVISSKPGSGARVTSGRAVSLTLAQHGARVPSVVGLSRREARASLRDAGFVVRQRARIVGDVDAVDSVLAQNVSPGTCAKPGRAIVITVGVAGQSLPDPTEPSTPPDVDPPAGTDPEPTPTPTSGEATPTG